MAVQLLCMQGHEMLPRWHTHCHTQCLSSPSALGLMIQGNQCFTSGRARKVAHAHRAIGFRVRCPACKHVLRYDLVHMESTISFLKALAFAIRLMPSLRAMSPAVFGKVGGRRWFSII